MVPHFCIWVAQAVISSEPPGVSVDMRVPDQLGTQPLETSAESCRPQTLEASWSLPLHRRCPGQQPCFHWPVPRHVHLLPPGGVLSLPSTPEEAPWSIFPPDFLISGDGPYCYQCNFRAERRRFRKQKQAGGEDQSLYPGHRQPLCDGDGAWMRGQGQGYPEASKGRAMSSWACTRWTQCPGGRPEPWRNRQVQGSGKQTRPTAGHRANSL